MDISKKIVVLYFDTGEKIGILESYAQVADIVSATPINGFCEFTFFGDKEKFLVNAAHILRIEYMDEKLVTRGTPRLTVPKYNN